MSTGIIGYACMLLIAALRGLILVENILTGARRTYRIPIKPLMSTVILSALLAVLSNIGTNFARYGCLGLNSAVDYMRFFAKTILIWFFLMLITTALFNNWDAQRGHLLKDRAGRPSTKIFFLLCWGTILCAWLVWIIPHWPGTMRDDTVTQYLQSIGATDYYTQHPLFDTLCFGAFFKLGQSIGSVAAGLFLFILVQAAITAAVFAAILAFLKSRGTPTTFLLIALAFYALSRTIYQPVDTMSKDAWNGWSLALSALLTVNAVTNPRIATKPWFVLSYSTVIFFCIASKRSMLYVVVPAALIGAFYVAHHHHCRKQALTMVSCILLGSLACIAVWTPLSAAVLQANNSPSPELWSLSEQQITAALKANPSVLSSEELKDLSTSCDYEAAVKVYNPHRSDEVSATVKQNSSKLPLLRAWLKVLTRDPLTCLQSLFNMAGQWFSLQVSIDYDHDLETELLTEERYAGWSADFNIPTQDLSNILSVFKISNSGNSPLKDAVECLDLVQRALTPLCSYGLYCTAIPLIVLTYGITRKIWGIVTLSAIPILLLLSFLVGPIALYWYSIPAVYIVPLVMALPYLFPNKKEASRS